MTHGYARQGTGRRPEYQSWFDMKRRCSSPNCKSFKRYGGRGIAVCERWLKFANFIADMGSMPAPGYTIERDDPDGNYEPGNCRWVTKKEQRSTVRSPKGECHTTIGLVEADILSIRLRAKTETQRSIAADYGMSFAQLSRIVNKKTWVHVP